MKNINHKIIISLFIGLFFLVGCEQQQPVEDNLGARTSNFWKTVSNKLQTINNRAVKITGDLEFMDEIKPDGVLCSDGQILKKTGADDWDCASDNSGSGGSAITFDIGDDGGNDSIDLTEIATTNDTNSIFTEPTADKLLIDVSKNWATADTANDLTCTDCVDDTDIEWGTGANQVNSDDIPDHNGHSIKDTFIHIINKGKATAITVSETGGLGISWTTGELYDGDTNAFIDTDAGSGNLTNHAVNYLKWVSGTALTISTTAPSGDEVLVATFSVYDGIISGYRETSLLNENISNARRGLRALFPTRIISGMSVHEDTDVTNPLDVTMDAGVLYKEAIEKKTPVEIKSRNTAMVRHFHTAGTWDSDTNAQIETTNYDNGTQKTAIPNNKYVKGLFIFMNGKIGFVYPTAYYNTIAQAQAGALPTMPTGLEPIPKLTAVVYEQGDADFTNAVWQDVRAGISEESFSGVSDHGALAGLGDDDHTQYALLAGRDGNSLAIDEIKAYDAAGLKLYDDGGNGIFVENDGNVGIGTTNPDAKLVVSGIVSAGNSEGGGGGSTVDGELRSYQSYADTPLYVAVKTADGKSGLYRNNAGYIVFFNLYTGDSVLRASFANSKAVIDGETGIEFDINETTKAVMDNNGNVGIGTTDPDTLLHIYDSTAVSTLYIESGGAGLGGRIIMEDSDAAGCSVLTTLNGVLTVDTITCP